MLPPDSSTDTPERSLIAWVSCCRPLTVPVRLEYWTSKTGLPLAASLESKRSSLVAEPEVCLSSTPFCAWAPETHFLARLVTCHQYVPSESCHTVCARSGLAATSPPAVVQALVPS